MTTIGYATLQLIPSLKGVSEAVDKQLGFLPGMGKKAGQQLGDGIAAGVKQAESAVKKSTDAIVKLRDKQADAVGKVRVAEQKLQELRDKGVTGGRLAAAEEARSKAYRGQASALRDVESETRSLTRAQKDLADASNNVGRNLGSAGGMKGFTSGITSQLNGLTGRFNSIGSGAGGGFAAGAIAAIAAGGFIAAGVKAAQLVASGFESVVTAGVGFDKTFNNFQAVTGSGTSQMAAFRQEAIALGGDTQLAGVNASDAATAMTELAKAGFTVEQAMAGARGTLQLAAAAQISAAEAATIEGNALNAFGLNADSAGKAADILANVANASSGEMTDFAYGLQAGGTVAHQFGLTIDDTATALGLLANSGIKGSDAGTLLKSALLALTDQGKPAQGAISELGLTVYDANGKFEGMRALFEQLNAASKRMTPEMYQAATNILFGSDAARLAGVSATQGAEGWDKMATAVAKQGTAAQVAATQNQGLPGVIANIQNSVDTMKLSLYDMISQLLTIGGGEGLKGLQSVADWMNGHKPEMIQFFSDIVQAAVVFGEMIAMQASVTLRSFALIAEQTGVMADLVGTALSKLAAPLQHIPDFLLGPGLAAVKHFGQEGGAALTDFGKGSQRVAGEMNNVGAAAGHLAMDTLPALGDKLQSVADKAIHAEEQNRLYSQSFKQIQSAIEQVPGSKDFVLKDNTPEVQEKLKQLGFTVTNLPDGRLTVRLEYRDQNGQLIDPSQLNAPVRAPAVPGDTYRGPGRAFGGSIFGPGTSTSDSVPIMASRGEHMWTAAEVNAVGGQANMYRLRALALKGALRRGLHRAGGGEIPLAVPWGVDPIGGPDRGPSAGPFRPWWDMDWTPPEHPEKVGPGKGWWWFHGPTHEKGITGGPLGPPLGRHRKPLPGDFVPGMIPNWKIKLWGFAGGGAIGPDVSAAGALVGTAYDKASRHDCSGMVARVIDRTLGMPEVGLMSTKNAADWLAARGFKKGIGGPGMISVGWYDHGPNPNDGHMAMTLSDGSNAEAGGGVGDIFQIGGGAAGASSPEFDQHMFLPTVFGEGPAGSGATSSPFAGGSAAAAMTGAGTPPSNSLPGSSPPSSGSSSGGSGFSLPSSISGLATWGLDSLPNPTAGLPDTLPDGSKNPWKQDSAKKFGDAASAAVGGQVDSLLGVFGVPGTPGWLKAASMLVSGIKVGGGSSAAPLSATPTISGTPPPDDPGNMHGGRAGRPPGPQTVYNIRTATVEDAFLAAQRKQNERNAAKLSRF